MHFCNSLFSYDKKAQIMKKEAERSLMQNQYTLNRKNSLNLQLISKEKLKTES